MTELSSFQQIAKLLDFNLMGLLICIYPAMEKIIALKT